MHTYMILGVAFTSLMCMGGGGPRDIDFYNYKKGMVSNHSLQPEHTILIHTNCTMVVSILAAM